MKPEEAQELLAFLRGHWPATVKFIGQLEEEGQNLGLWWTDRWPHPRAVLCRARSSLSSGAFSLFAVDEGLAERILDGIDWSREVRFSGLDTRFLSLVRRRAGTVSDNPCGMFRLEKTGFRPFQAPDAGTHPVEPLRREDAALITRYWAYGEDESYPLSRIEGSPTTCIRIGGQPVAWALVHYDGSIGMVYTLEEHRRKGYARAVVSALVEERFRSGRAPFCFIVDGNQASVRLFQGLGFFRQADLSWVFCAPEEEKSEAAPSGPTCEP
ncbi:MAG: GNAT family N-acetyltransferase [Nitrospinota bacterium]